MPLCALASNLQGAFCLFVRDEVATGTFSFDAGGRGKDSGDGRESRFLWSPGEGSAACYHALAMVVV